MEYRNNLASFIVQSPMETSTVCIRRCIPEAKGNIPLPSALFIVYHTDGNTDRHKLSVYSRGDGNYFPP
jgi:hypothetical protein